LTARRLVERGVRFVQVIHGYSTDTIGWDAHFHLKKLHGRTCSEVDHPIGGLLKDLKQRGLLGETLVVWETEFGRTPGVQGPTGGRDHHPPAFSPAGWPVAESKVESPTALPTNSATTPSRTATTSRTFTPPSCISLGSTPRNWTCPVTSVSKSTTANQFTRSSRSGWAAA